MELLRVCLVRYTLIGVTQKGLLYTCLFEYSGQVSSPQCPSMSWTMVGGERVCVFSCINLCLAKMWLENRISKMVFCVLGDSSHFSKCGIFLQVGILFQTVNHTFLFSLWIYISERQRFHRKQTRIPSYLFYLVEKYQKPSYLITHKWSNCCIVIPRPNWTLQHRSSESITTKSDSSLE